MRGSLLALILFFICSYSFAQVKGVVKNKEDGTPFPAVNVLIKNPKDSINVAFGVTNSDGVFIIENSIDLDTVLIQVRSMTIQSVSVMVKIPNSQIEIFTSSSSLDLEEFTVEGIKNPISIRNDTVSYDISGFSRASDRVIGDVIKRLPGLEVSANGMISFEGKPLQKFYIEGLDLLEGRYNLANSTIPADAVESVQILENHQPIRVLDSLVFSDRTSLNIKLKKKNVWSGSGKLGAGLSPFIWDAELSPMLFSSKFQTLNTIRSNSIGENLDDQTAVLTIEDLKSRGFSAPKLTPWVQVDQITSGMIPFERLIFNRSHLGSINALSKLNNQAEFRINIGHIRQELSASGQAFSIFYLPGEDTVSFSEEKTSQINMTKTWGDFTITKNVSNSFFSNKVSFQFLKNDDQAQTLFDRKLRDQNSQLPFLSFSNSLQTIQPILGFLSEVRSELSIQATDQFLEVSPSQLGSTSPNENSLRVLQNVNFNRLFTNNSIGTAVKLIPKVTYNLTFGIKAIFDKLNSSIDGRTMENSDDLDLFINKSSYHLVNSYLSQSFQYKNDKWTFQFELPIRVQQIQIVDQLDASNSSKSGRVFMEPNFYGRFQVSGKFFTTISIRKNNDYGTLYEKFSGRIIRNFRTIYQLNSSLPELIGTNYSLGLNFKDPVSSWFVSGRISYNNYLANTVSQTFISPLGETIFSALDLENNSRSYVGSVQLSKYLSSIYSTFSGGVTFQDRISPRLINQVLTDIAIGTSSFDFSYSFKPRTLIGLTLNSTFFKIENGFGDLQFNKVFLLTNTAMLELFPNDFHVFALDYSSPISWSSSNSAKLSTEFFDFSYRWIIPKTKWEIEFEVLNILDKSQFENFSSSSNFETFQVLQLRPRQAVLRALFKF